ncbi:cell division protein ZipA C-terminal FtsZ-binding domain-containing protein [Acinetobacter lwoffii]|uniref:cell division protein ZipA C-terminal FtsZ-binding domain-containing protein n=1 Tax=Acinetobacter lwoffii TaxID=28090 RepID=UPI0012DD309A|nr:cell division protein ZipA C-terminal FtsZ-binding domain-containing protein [Acinetobacter lwoffii]MCO8096823.1 cell division protein ZipA [Acinetobacter lwoffii]MCO8114472.1 cell division protein ZipA [Acinetobacter lwoffii]MCU4613808.1 cell division protein ZipA [Acinetobacter lwoffii]NKS44791.1 cell division protein ZipA [Acinetobacter lwoffii]QGR75499.1 cell division protein ZipA [Acinetobacter lwoffii]
MEITTIIGIVIAIVIMLFGIRMLFKKPVEAVPSLDANLHIDPDSQTPIIPRHVRSQLAQQDVESDRIEPSLSIDEPAPEKPSVFHKAESTPVEPTAVETLAVVPSTEAEVEAKSVVTAVDIPQVKAEQENSQTETKEETPEFSLNSNIEKAEISEFNDESSILDAHLHEQKIVDEESALSNAETIISLHIYPQGRVLSGDKTLKVLLKYGLRYGELACFHRYSEDGSKLLFSVLQMTDTGMEGFDLETLSTQEVKGLAFFLALPHSDVQNAFDTMDSISRLIAREVDGLVYDQNQQEFTPQLREFWRHQAIDYRAGQGTEV